ncbi:MAG: bifunctional homocysteine S-methyltransferase/methylenetetrahydrofolate reductase [Candidatus Krumholzibacteriota bacterium]|nr:bifunctional homocysteine S-methyltransferase/methylenetetrahydrofolate reductase [Candidatus Krumholzibacteriota bacterium]
MPAGFLELLEEGIVLFDGAMGTMLYERGVFINRSFDEINLSNPRLVERIHREYVEAGAEVVETNTFGANRCKLSLHGLDDRLAEINRRGVEIAREATGGEALVAGSIGPLGIRIEPWGPTSNDEAAATFAEQAEAIMSVGVDLFVLETFADLNEIHQAIRGVRRVADVPVVALMTLQRDGLGLYGTEPDEFAVRLVEWGADVVGVNCSVGPKIMLDAVEKMSRAVDTWIAAQPNAGIPQNVEGRNIYMTSPEYLGEYARRFARVGVRVIGGCCGTTPAHIRAIREALKTVRPSKTSYHVDRPSLTDEADLSPVPIQEKSALAARVAAGEFVRLVELVPPVGSDPSGVIAAAAELRSAGIDAINIPDSPRATSRMSPLALAVLVEREAGIETVLHYCCRDRNILGMQSDLLGAHALGLRNILLITGDPIRTEDYPDATSVFDIDSIGLTNVVHGLNQGRDIGGRRLRSPTAFHIGVGANPGAVNAEEEMHRFSWKVKAGAEFVVTQPIFDVMQLRRFIDAMAPRALPVIAGVWPLVSYRNAEFMNNELPGVSVPGEILARMREAGSGDAAVAEGVSIASGILREIRPLVAGVQVSAPFNRHSIALEVIARGLGEDLASPRS